MRVLVTALELVAAGNWLSQYKVDDVDPTKALDLINSHAKATQVRRFLHSIPAYPIRKALHISNNLRLNRMTTNFEKALFYAKLILRKEQFLPIDDEGLGDATWCWSEDMSDIWENLLFQGYQKLKSQGIKVMYYDRSDGDCSIYPPESVPSAFGSGQDGDSFPDILVKLEKSKNVSENWIIDAKYSFFGSLPNTPSGRYRDQMFRYLYLMSKKQAEKPNLDWQEANYSEPWADQMALIYTTNEKYLMDSGRQVQSIWRRDWHERPNLYQIAMPFPTEDDVSEFSKWKSFQASFCEKLAESLKQKQPPKATEETK